MQFNLLGPLEVVRGESPVNIGGVNQRAVLGYLLLNANRVVSARQLIRAVWGESGPPTARKMLHNAVAGLRGILPAGDGGPGAPALVTRAPGYVLQIDVAAMDMTVFQRRWNQGRADRAGGNCERAALMLQGALSLWRGRVLADLLEVGVDWPEMAAVQKTWTAALEDYVETLLAMGRYDEMIEVLEEAVRAEPQRERLCGYLMLALYRGGRQAEALARYRAVRHALVEDLGLDPSLELQELERAILDHDPKLLTGGQVGPAIGAAPVAAPAHGGLSAIGRGGAQVVPAQRTGEVGAPARPPARPTARPSAGVALQRSQVSVLLVEADVAAPTEAGGLGEAEAAHRAVTAAVLQEVERHGGIVNAVSGGERLALFGAVEQRGDDAERAVRTALAIQDRLAGPPCRNLEGAAALRGVRAVVATGDALVIRRDENGMCRAPVALGPMEETARRLLPFVPVGGVRVCDSTQEALESATERFAADHEAAAVWPASGPYPGCPDFLPAGLF
ncbi:BTAD domain-containing putative transcriptional regulator [Kitasatospora sp. NPDC059327]|uniref:BTAD domain-containing putative transcriptional regulator n=1 Tax=Kitasatospora sp. NPDC059327 TaxID=3346803 RepID=UPI00368E1ED5